MVDTTPSRTAAGKPVTKPPGSTRLGLIVGGLVVALIGGFALGKATATPATSTGSSPSGVGATFNESMPHTHPAMPGMTGTEVGGLSISSAGYTLTPVQTDYKTGEQTLTFAVTGPDRKPVTDFSVVHDRPMHMIVARRDLSGYQHLHPAMAPDGTWTVKVNLDRPGPWRAVADFTANSAGGAQTALTLGTDLTVAGAYPRLRFRPPPGRPLWTVTPWPTKAPCRSVPPHRCCSGSSRTVPR